MRDFADFFRSLPYGGKKKLATRLGVSYNYLDMICKRTRYPSHDLARRIKEHTGISLESWGRKEQWIRKWDWQETACLLFYEYRHTTMVRWTVPSSVLLSFPLFHLSLSMSG